MTSRQDAILQASAAAIAENGVRGLRVSDVAQVAGVSSGLLYYHFKDRDGLLAAALTYINDQARACRQAASGPEVSRAHLIEHLLAEIQCAHPPSTRNRFAHPWHERPKSGHAKPRPRSVPPRRSARCPRPSTPTASPCSSTHSPRAWPPGGFPTNSALPRRVPIYALVPS
ncbi:Putative transcriptional regulator, TetR family [Mycobacteroides abscessus subsp. massiliense]|nr:Putative transcriptional regulator, TetR family [Mycobacteroides abscessus subsp. massiliense]